MITGYKKNIIISAISIIFLFIFHLLSLENSGFKVVGNLDLLQDAIVNIEVFSAEDKKINSLVYKSNVYKVNAEGIRYGVYIYKNGMVGYKEYDNIFYSKDHMYNSNYIELNVDGDIFFITHYYLTKNGNKVIRNVIKANESIDKYINREIPNKKNIKEREELKNKFLQKYK